MNVRIENQELGELSMLAYPGQSLVLPVGVSHVEINAGGEFQSWFGPVKVDPDATEVEVFLKAR